MLVGPINPLIRDDFSRRCFFMALAATGSFGMFDITSSILLDVFDGDEKDLFLMNEMNLFDDDLVKMILVDLIEIMET